MTVRDTVIEDSKACSGALGGWGGNLRATNLTVRRCVGSCGTGGGGGAAWMTAQSNSTFDRCLFESNSAPVSDGGAFSFYEAGFIVFNNSVFRNNTAFLQGGAISYGGDLATLTIENTTFDGNAAGGCGGAVAVTGGRGVSISTSAFSNNAAAGAEGGGAVCYPAAVPRTMCAAKAELTASRGDFSVVPIGERIPFVTECNWRIGACVVVSCDALCCVAL